MEQPTWAGVRAIVLAVMALFLLPLQAQAERDWEFSAGVFGGKAFHSNASMKIRRWPRWHRSLARDTRMTLNDDCGQLEENLQLGIFPDNINGNRKWV